jgi:uncharacterized protein YjbI with pentapeptide repeats
MSEKETPKLTPAEENPWYVLATIYGEEPSWLIQNRNQRVWNAWAMQELNDEEKQRMVAVDRNLSSPTFANWRAIENEVKKLFNKRLPDENLPDPSYIVFSGIEFIKGVDLSNYVFAGPVIFDNTAFLSEVTFSGSIFTKYITFNKTTFKQRVDFTEATFSNKTIFNDTTFQSLVDFGGAAFGRNVHFSAVCEGVSSFFQCSFEKSINLMTSKFKSAYPILTGANLDVKATFSPFPQNWPGPYNCRQNFFEAKESCATLRHIMNLQGRPEQAHFFFRREMHFASKIGSIWERFPYLLFGWLSNYGHSLKRPLHALTWLWALPTIFFWLKDCTGKCANTIGAEIWISLLKAAGLSIANILKFTGIQRVYYEIKDFDALVPLVSDAQTLLAIPLLFLLLLGLRNRFRLK